jgi:hypothetical protein
LEKEVERLTDDLASVGLKLMLPMLMSLSSVLSSMNLQACVFVCVLFVRPLHDHPSKTKLNERIIKMHSKLTSTSDCVM